MTSIRALSAVLSLTLLAAGTVAPRAEAEWGPILLVSKGAAEQAEFADQAALSADGRYVAFRALIGGLRGVFRKDLEGGALQPVVAGSAYVSNPEAGSAEPSISADGRYVSFTTAARLDPGNDQAAASRDVYVADLSSAVPTYELASALDGSPVGLSYSGNGGAQATGRVSLSADGRKIVFVTNAASNLGGTAGDTPAGQVVLRDLAAGSTTLISSRRDPATGAMEPDEPVPGGAVMSNGSSISPGAALSADGSTVAWLGAGLASQVPLLADEAQEIASRQLQLPYDEPLWRRVPTDADPAPPTRRIVGGGDPLAPGCPSGGTLADPACRGPFPELADGHPNLTANNQCATNNGWIAGKFPFDVVPKLSADGRTVALLGEPNGFANVFAVDMTAPSRVAAVRQLTRELPIFEENGCLTRQLDNLVGSADVESTAISADGRQIAFTTQRQQFPLAPPNLIGAPPASMGVTELYRIDLGGEALARVTHGAAAMSEPSKVITGLILNPTLPGAASASFSGDGRRLAFVSKANNLVAADGNSNSSGTEGGMDVFTVDDLSLPAGAGDVSISPPPPGPGLKPRWKLSVSAASRRDGSVRLAVAVPGPGRLRATAIALVGPAAKRRRVAGARRRAGQSPLVFLRLRPAPRFRRLAHSDSGIEATVRVSFAGPGGKPLGDSLDVRFRVGEGV